MSARLLLGYAAEAIRYCPLSEVVTYARSPCQLRGSGLSGISEAGHVAFGGSNSNVDVASDTTVRGEEIAIASQCNEPRFMLLLQIVEAINSRPVSSLQTEAVLEADGRSEQ